MVRTGSIQKEKLMSFARSGFAQFIASGWGRLMRIIVGLGLIAWGYMMRDAGTGVALMVVGLVPLLAGVFDLCLISPLLGGPLSGRRIRSARPL